MATLAEIRAQYPQYQDMSDQDLADRMYQRFYSDMPRDQFDAKVGFTPKKEPSMAESVADLGLNAMRGINKGVANLVTAPYRILDWAGEKVTGGDFLPNAEDMPLYKTYLQPQAAETDAGRYAQAAGEAVGSSVIPSGALLAKAPQLAALAPTTLPRAAAQTVGETIASSPGRAVAADVIAGTGAGLAQEKAKESGFGPGGQMLAGVVGGVAPLAAVSTLSNARAAIQGARASADPYARVAAGLGDTSVDDLANAVAVGNTAENLGINRFALDVLGQEMVKAGGNRRAAVPATLARLQAQGVSPTAAKDQLRRIMGVHEDSDLLLGEFPAVMESNMATRLARNLENVTDEQAGALRESGVQRLIDYVANTGSMASSTNVRNAIAQRGLGLRDSTAKAIQDLAPSGRTIQDVEADTQALLQAARQEYDNVYNAPGGTLVDNSKLHSGMQGIVEKYADLAAGRAGEQAAALRAALEEFFVPLPNGERLLMPSLAMAQDMRGALRGIISRNARAGNDHLVNTLQPLYRDVTRIMEEASPAWAVANRRYADLRLEEVASDLGSAFAKSAGPRAREQLKEFQALAPEAQDIVRIHFVQQLLDRIENASKLGGMKNLGDLFSSAHTRTMVRDVLGDKAAVQLSRLIRDAGAMARSRDMIKGSQTQPRQQMQAEQDADLNVLSSAANMDWRDWKGALFEKAKAFMRERRNKVVGRVVTTPMRDTAAIAENLERMRQARARVEALSRPRRRQPGGAGQVGNILSVYED